MWVVFIIPYAFISPIYFKIILITTMTDERSNKQMRVRLPPQTEIHPILMMLNHLSPPPTAPAPHTVSLVLTAGGGAILWQRHPGAPVPSVGAGTDPAGRSSYLPPPCEQTSHPRRLVPPKKQRLSRPKVVLHNLGNPHSACCPRPRREPRPQCDAIVGHGFPLQIMRAFQAVDCLSLLPHLKYIDRKILPPSLYLFSFLC